MCRLDPSQVLKLFQAMEFKHQDRYRKSYNAGPMRFLPVAYKEESKEESKTEGCEVIIEAMQWGLYRPGSTDLVINGRFEELVDKPMFRGLLEKKRCVVIIPLTQCLANCQRVLRMGRDQPVKT